MSFPGEFSGERLNPAYLPRPL